MTTPAQSRASAKYDKAHTKGIYLKLNIETDKDIIEHLGKVENVQGYIKDLIRYDMYLDKDLPKRIIAKI